MFCRPQRIRKAKIGRYYGGSDAVLDVSRNRPDAPTCAAGVQDMVQKLTEGVIAMISPYVGGQQRCVLAGIGEDEGFRLVIRAAGAGVLDAQ